MDEEFDQPVSDEDCFEDGRGRLWRVALLGRGKLELDLGTSLLRLAVDDPSELALAFDPEALSRFLPSVVVQPGHGSGRDDEDLRLSLRGEVVARDAAGALACALLNIAGDNAAMRSGITEAMSIAGLVGSSSPFEGVHHE